MDPILYWNDVAQEAVRRDFTHDSLGDSFDPGKLQVQQPGPTRTSRALAMVHLAMYEAYARSNPGTLAPFAPPGGPTVPAAPTGVADPDFTAGAISGAALVVLTAHWSRQSGYFRERCNSLHQATPKVAFTNGRVYGHAVGEAILAWRAMDGSEVVDDPTYSQAHGRHRPDPFDPAQGRNSTHWGKVKPFCIPSPATGDIHTGYVDAPPSIDTPRYDSALMDVRKEGAVQTASRSPRETLAGIFWGYDGARGIGVPPRLYNQVVREFARQHLPTNSPEDNARLYALINVGMADAAIVAWSAKYVHDLWRPVIGIRHQEPGFGLGTGASDGPNGANCDPGWAPLGRPGTNTLGDFTKTPDFPAYPSGHATFGAVAFKLAAQFYAERSGVSFDVAFKETLFDFTSDEYNGVNRDPHGDVRPYHRRSLTLGYAVAENALSRVWLGVHWRFDGLGATLPPELTGITQPRKIPRDPSSSTGGAGEATLGGVPAGFKVADLIFPLYFRP